MKINKNGIVETNLFNENITLSDGSLFTPILVHHIDDGANMFATTDNFSSIVYHSSNLWANFNLISTVTRYDSNYEFLVLQQNTNNGDWSTYRFRQSINPMTGTWDNVKPGSTNVTWITGGSSSYGGMYKLNSPTATSSNYMCFANGSNGNWFGCGCKQLYQGGIPGICNTVPKGWQIVYIRISKSTVSMYNNLIISNEFIEY